MVDGIDMVAAAKRMLAAILFVAVSLPAFAHAAGFTGVWQAEYYDQYGKKLRFAFVLTEKDSGLTGSVYGIQAEPVPISDGHAKGDAISFRLEYTSAKTGTPQTVDFKATRKGKELAFTQQLIRHHGRQESPGPSVQYSAVEVSRDTSIDAAALVTAPPLNCDILPAAPDDKLTPVQRGHRDNFYQRVCNDQMSGKTVGAGEPVSDRSPLRLLHEDCGDIAVSIDFASVPSDFPERMSLGSIGEDAIDGVLSVCKGRGYSPAAVAKALHKIEIRFDGRPPDPYHPGAPANAELKGTTLIYHNHNKSGNVSGSVAAALQHALKK